VNIRDALEREVERAGDEDLTAPQLVGRPTPLPTDAALKDRREADEAGFRGGTPPRKQALYHALLLVSGKETTKPPLTGVGTGKVRYSLVLSPST